MRLQNVFVPNVLEIFTYETRGESPGGFPGDFGYDIIAGPHSMIEEKHPTIVLRNLNHQQHNAVIL